MNYKLLNRYSNAENSQFAWRIRRLKPNFSFKSKWKHQSETCMHFAQSTFQCIQSASNFIQTKWSWAEFSHWINFFKCGTNLTTNNNKTVYTWPCKCLIHIAPHNSDVIEMWLLSTQVGPINQEFTVLGINDSENSLTQNFTCFFYFNFIFLPCIVCKI